MKTTSKIGPPLKKIFFCPLPLFLKIYLKVLLMTSHHDSHSSADPGQTYVVERSTSTAQVYSQPVRQCGPVYDHQPSNNVTNDEPCLDGSNLAPSSVLPNVTTAVLAQISGILDTNTAVTCVTRPLHSNTDINLSPALLESCDYDYYHLRSPCTGVTITSCL